MTSASDILRLRRRFGASGVDLTAFFAISASNSLQKSSAIQKISVTLLSVIMICNCFIDTIKLLKINEFAKQIDNYFSRRFPFFAIFSNTSYPELASSIYFKLIRYSILKL